MSHAASSRLFLIPSFSDFSFFSMLKANRRITLSLASLEKQRAHSTYSVKHNIPFFFPGSLSGLGCTHQHSANEFLRDRLHSPKNQNEND